jgi:hypothetical protein
MLVDDITENTLCQSCRNEIDRAKMLIRNGRSVEKVLNSGLMYSNRKQRRSK